MAYSYIYRFTFFIIQLIHDPFVFDIAYWPYICYKVRELKNVLPKLIRQR